MALCTVLNHLADVPATIRRAAAILCHAVTKHFAPHDSSGATDLLPAFASLIVCRGGLRAGGGGRHVLFAFCVTSICAGVRVGAAQRGLYAKGWFCCCLCVSSLMRSIAASGQGAAGAGGHVGHAQGGVGVASAVSFAVFLC